MYNYELGAACCVTNHNGRVGDMVSKRCLEFIKRKVVIQK